MGNTDDSNGDKTTVSMTIEGEYGAVISKLRTGGDETDYLTGFVDDVGLLLETVEQTGGGTRSAIARSLPEESSLADDPDTVVNLLQVLERYDLVDLDGNTWMPGSRLSGD
jgi:hypothetical protein